MKDYLYLSYFTIYTQKTPEEVCAILQEQTAAWGIGYWPLGEGVFVGEIGTSSFKVVPRPPWGSPRGFCAVLEGSIKTKADETVVDVKMRFPWSVYLLFPLVFLLVVGFLLWEGPFPPHIYKLVFLFVCGVEILFGAVAGCWFHFDARRAREDMEYLLRD